MMLIKNVASTLKGDRFLRTQYQTLLSKVVDGGVRTCFFQLTTKFQPTFYFSVKLNYWEKKHVSPQIRTYHFIFLG
jgi:hypothetical protein